jgi:protein CpxP
MTTRGWQVLPAILAMMVAGMVSLAVAQDAPHHGGFGFEHHMLHFLTEQLDLTDAQQTQVKEIFAKEKPTMAPLLLQNGQLHQQLMQAAIAGNFDEAKIRTLAAQQGQLEAALAVEHARIASQIFNILTPDQKTKAQEILAKHQEHMREHFEHMQHGQTPSAEPQQ